MADLAGTYGQQITEVKLFTGTQNSYGGNQLFGSTTGAASAIAPSLAATAGKFNYCTGFMVGGLGATAATRVQISIANIAGGTPVAYLEIPAGVTTIISPLIIMFPTPIVSTGVNTAITINVPSFGSGNTSVWAAIWGFAYA